MSEQSPSTMHDDLAKAFDAQAELNAFVADESIVLDRNVKTQTRKKLNGLMKMMDTVKQYRDDVPEDVIRGIEEVIVNTDAKLTGKPMRFTGDEVEMDAADAAALNQMAA